MKDFHKRLIEEAIFIDDKINKLEKYEHKNRLMKKQLHYMKKYKDILDKRIMQDVDEITNDVMQDILKNFEEIKNVIEKEIEKESVSK